jgi:hypothetical protein
MRPAVEGEDGPEPGSVDCGDVAGASSGAVSPGFVVVHDRPQSRHDVCGKGFWSGRRRRPPVALFFGEAVDRPSRPRSGAMLGPQRTNVRRVDQAEGPQCLKRPI